LLFRVAFVTGSSGFQCDWIHFSRARQRLRMTRATLEPPTTKFFAHVERALLPAAFDLAVAFDLGLPHTVEIKSKRAGAPAPH
jgi:hypothetical protein